MTGRCCVGCPDTISNQDLRIGRPNFEGPMEKSSRDEIYIPEFLFLGGPWVCGVRGLFAVASGPELVPRGCGVRGAFAVVPELSWGDSRSSSPSWVALSAIFLGVTGSMSHSAVERGLEKDERRGQDHG